jgi:Protein of unknown function (DUF3501)
VTDELTPGEIRTGEEYEGVRSEARRGVAEMQRHRRVALNERLTLVFENRESVRSVVEEVVRAERLTDAPHIAREVEAFRPLVPPPGELRAALYLEVSDPAELGEHLERLQGVERAVYLEIAGSRVDGVALAVAAADEAPAAYCIGFSLGAEHRAAWLRGQAVVAGVDHPAAQGRVELGPDQREALAGDLRSGTG